MKTNSITTRLIAGLFLLFFLPSFIIAQCTIAGYPFDANANDTSSNAYHATVNGASLTSDRFGNPNSAYLFDGINDFIDAGNIIDLSQETAVTISAWFNPTVTDNYYIRQTGISIGTKSTGELMLRTGYPGDDKFQAALADGTSSSASGASNSVKSDTYYSFNNWYHLVAIYQDNKVEMWIDGVKQSDSAQNLGGSVLSTVPSNSPLWIGKSSNPNKTKFFKGKIDDIIILGCVADSSMIQSWYNTIPAGAPCTIVGYPFNGNPNDSTANGNHAIVNGATLTTDRFGTPNSAYEFDGINDFLDAGNIIDPAQYSALTISAWFNPTITDNDFIRQTGISIGTKSAGELMLRTGYPGDDKFQAALADGTNQSSNGAGNSSKSATYNFNQWYHLVATYQDNKVELWVDGVKQSDSTRNLGGTTLSTVPATASLWIGKSVNPSKTKFFKGKIDDIVILGCVADSAMIQTLYSANTGLAVENHEMNNQWHSAYPNPSSGVVNIEINAEEVIICTKVYNQIGQLVKVFEINENTNIASINIANLDTGIYTLIIQSDKQEIIQRILKK